MTPRDRQILALYARGLSMSEIGLRLGGISKQAVNHVLRRLDAPRRDPPAVTQAELAHQRRLEREAAARERDAVAVALIRAGELTYREIAEQLGAGLSTIQGIARRHGVGPGRGERSHLAWEKRERDRHKARNARIVRMVLAGRHTYAEVAERFGLSASRVREIAVEAGAGPGRGGRAALVARRRKSPPNA